MKMEGLIEGRIVHYVLTEDDTKQIGRRRTTGFEIAKLICDEKWPKGAQAHMGNMVKAGDHYPMIICKVWDKQSGSINGQVMLDGCDTFWVCSKLPETEIAGKYKPGTWHWIERT
jgi:hypothetical protein